jgi:hypothetical protein
MNNELVSKEDMIGVEEPTEKEEEDISEKETKSPKPNKDKKTKENNNMDADLLGLDEDVANQQVINTNNFKGTEILTYYICLVLVLKQLLLTQVLTSTVSALLIRIMK